MSTQTSVASRDLSNPPASPVRLDAWAAVALSPTDEPNELKPRGGVFRGMPELDAACKYAREVSEFFVAQGACGVVYVVKGPTSTTRSPFEVVDACCGYSVAYKVDPTVQASRETTTDAVEDLVVERQRECG